MHDELYFALACVLSKLPYKVHNSSRFKKLTELYLTGIAGACRLPRDTITKRLSSCLIAMMPYSVGQSFCIM